eukprot:gene4812-5276_t
MGDLFVEVPPTDSFELSLSTPHSLPENDTKRIRLLRDPGFLERNNFQSTSSDFERFCHIATRALKMPVAIITLVDVSMNWVVTRSGFSTEASIQRNLGFCSYCVLESAPSLLLVPDATKDGRFQDSVFVTQSEGVRFYAGAAILCGQVKIGTLCVIDTVPHDDFKEDQQHVLRGLADLVAVMIEEKRGMIMTEQGELARLIIAVNQHLQAPIRAMRQDVDFLAERLLRRADRSVGGRSPRCYQEETDALLRNLHSQAMQLSLQIEMALNIAAAYNNSYLHSQKGRELQVEDKLLPATEQLHEIQKASSVAGHWLAEMTWHVDEADLLKQVQTALSLRRESLVVLILISLLVGAWEPASSRADIYCQLLDSSALAARRHVDNLEFSSVPDLDEFLSKVLSGDSERASQGVQVGVLVVRVVLRQHLPSSDLNAAVFDQSRLIGLHSNSSLSEIDIHTVSQCSEMLSRSIACAEGGGYVLHRTLPQPNISVLESIIWIPCHISLFLSS